MEEMETQHGEPEDSTLQELFILNKTVDDWVGMTQIPPFTTTLN